MYDVDLKPGQQLISYIDIDPSEADRFGMYKEKYQILDANGNAVEDGDVDINGYNKIGNIAKQLTSRELFYDPNYANSIYNGRYRIGGGESRNQNDGTVTGNTGIYA